MRDAIELRAHTLCMAHGMQIDHILDIIDEQGRIVRSHMKLHLHTCPGEYTLQLGRHFLQLLNHQVTEYRQPAWEAGMLRNPSPET
jgi:hypothetical protein